MHGRVKRDSESCRSLRRSSSQHMRPVLPAATTIASSITSDSFFKDGRKISVGDCALFKPPKNSPPLIGLIRLVAFNEENNLKLGVNWLYRSSELKLGKGSLLDTAPNEIFYSFHKDETPAASLLHPCKVAFLRRGVELPAGTASFVCRRAYDISNKCLRWLTDQDYINEQQEEVNQLLSKTRTEMHVTLQPGGSSPKQVNGPTSSSQLKSASDGGQTNGTSIPSQAKAKKRERGDHGADPVKRERSSSRSDDGDIVQCTTETSLKNEISRITEKGGVTDLEGVDKLVQLMQLDGIERKIDLVSRSMLVSVMASSDKVDCLNRFVQLKGLPVLDDWLQDIQKGKIGNCSNPKDGDKSVEEFLLVLLRALDKLPVNLQALQMCNIGRSVNHLRSHKHVEIQRKARTLVDTWKKRVEAEMNMLDGKSGSTHATAAWPSKSRLPEASHCGNRTPSGSDNAMKNSTSHNSAAKATSVRSSHGESSIKYASSSLGDEKPAMYIASGRASKPKTSVGGTVDAPQIREDGSSSSNQSLSAKDDMKIFTSGTVTVNKTSISSTRNRISASGSKKENSPTKISSAHITTALEKLSHSAITNEKIVEGAIRGGSSHKLIVKIPNRVRSPAQASSLSLEDDVGMNLIASVAAGEMSRSNMVSPADSMDRSIHVADEACAGDEAKSKSTTEECTAVESECDGKKQAVLDDCSWSDGGLHMSKDAPLEFSGDKRCAASQSSEDIDAGKRDTDVGSTSTNLRSNADHVLETTRKPNGKIDTSSLSPPFSIEIKDSESNEGVHKEEATINTDLNSRLNCRSGGTDAMVTEEKDSDLPRVDECKPVLEVAGSKSFDQYDCSKVVTDGLNSGTNAEHKLTAASVKFELAETANCEKLHQAECDQISVPGADDADNVGELNDGAANSCMSKSGGLNFDKEVDKSAADESHVVSDLCSTSRDLNNHRTEAKVENQVTPNHILAPVSRCSDVADHEAQEEPDLTGSKYVSIQPDEAGKYALAGTRDASPSTTGGTNPGVKLMFDLNEGFTADDTKYEESVTSTSSGPTIVEAINSLSFFVDSIPSSHSASITVAATSKGSFVPSEDLVRGSMELGWKGSAATGAFQPAEPRKVLENLLGPANVSCLDVPTSKHDRIPLDIDLNVPDERVLEEMTSRCCTLIMDSATNSTSSRVTLLNEASNSLHVHGCGGLDLDLNRVDDANDAGHCSTSSNPKVDSGSAEEFPLINQLVRGGTSQLPSAGPRTNSSVMGNVATWFSPGNGYSTIIPSLLPEQREQLFSVFPAGASQRTFGPTSVAPCNPEVYHGSVLTSSPAVAYPSGPFQLPVFPYGATTPLPTFSVGAPSYVDSSAARPFASPINSQYLGPVGSVTSQFQRPYMVTFPDIGNNGMPESNIQWSRQGMYLNSGLGAMVSEVREEMLPLSSGQQSVATSQGLAEEQARMFSVSGGILKRKERDGGWDNETIRRKQSS